MLDWNTERSVIVAVGSVPVGLGERNAIWIAGEKRVPPVEEWDACLSTGLRIGFLVRGDVSHLKKRKEKETEKCLGYELSLETLYFEVSHRTQAIVPKNESTSVLLSFV